MITYKLAETLHTDNLSYGFLSLSFPVYGLHQKRPPGYFHLLEHLIMESSSPHYKDLSSMIRSFKGSVVAFTDLHFISLHFLLPTDVQPNHLLKIIKSHLENLEFKDEVIAHEKQLVNEELSRINPPGELYQKIFRHYTGDDEVFKRLYGLNISDTEVKDYAHTYQTLQNETVVAYSGPHNQELEENIEDWIRPANVYLKEHAENITLTELGPVFESLFRNSGNSAVRINDFQNSVVIPLDSKDISFTSRKKTMAEIIHFTSNPPVNLDIWAIQRIHFLRRIRLRDIAHCLGLVLDSDLPLGSIRQNILSIPCSNEQTINLLFSMCEIASRILYRENSSFLLKPNITGNLVNVVFYHFDNGDLQSPESLLIDCLKRIPSNSYYQEIVDELETQTDKSEKTYPDLFILHEALSSVSAPGSFSVKDISVDILSVCRHLNSAYKRSYLNLLDKEVEPSYRHSELSKGYVLETFNTETLDKLMWFKSHADKITYRIYDMQLEWQKKFGKYSLDVYSHAGTVTSFIKISQPEPFSPDEEIFLRHLLKKYFAENTASYCYFNIFDRVFYLQKD